MYVFVISSVVILTFSCGLFMLFKVLTRQDDSGISRKHFVILAISGVLSYISDTIGVGSFAVSIAIARFFRLVKDAELPGFINAVQVIPGAVEAVLFLGVIHVDAVTFITLIIGTSIGGFIGGIYASKVDAVKIRLIMIFAFIVVILLLLANLNHIIPVGGNMVSLCGIKLIVGFCGMFCAGFLVCFGVGSYALIQSVLFVLGMSPLAAFPIMTSAAAIQQPITTFAFIYAGKIPYKKILIMSFFGIIGVFIGFQMISTLSTTQLHSLLVLVLSYNTVSLIRSYLKGKG
jgi:uncharacterized membrane protein YfcA